MQLKGFGFSGYRSFGDNLTKISPLQKVNLIIGQNNVGKSNIINFLYKQYPYFLSKVQNKKRFIGSQKEEVPFEEIDRHISSTLANYRIAFPLFSHEIEGYIDNKIPKNSMNGIREILLKLLKSKPLMDDNGDIWFIYKSESYKQNFTLEIDANEIAPALSINEWDALFRFLTNTSGGELISHRIPEVVKILAEIPSEAPIVEVIPAIRKIGLAGSEASDFSGEGIIERLAKIQNPPLTNQLEKEKFSTINTFLQNVLENKTAEIEIPYKRDMILIHMDNKTLPLSSLGTGVHEVVILAAASTLLENTIICVEEPELHLHPLLQRKLITYLSEKTTNQYFFTTHSAHLMDSIEAQIFHVTQNEGISKVRAISSTEERSKICNDLGYKASDILQANCIIWVEGPSDRIYLNYWLKQMPHDFIEGVHYSIMFYGGKLFSHLSADDEIDDKLTDFISLRKLNRNAIIMFDSDRDKPKARLSSTKNRLKNEFNSDNGFAWITKGREVENYLNYDALEQSIIAVHPSAKKIISKDQWSNLLKYKKTRSNSERTASKVKVAKHYIANNPVDFSVLDLHTQLKKLCSFISSVN